MSGKPKKPLRLSTTLALGLVLLVAGCGNDPNTGVGARMALGLAKSTAARVTGGKPAATPAPAAAPDPAALIGKALAATDGPVMLVVEEASGGVTAMGLRGENGPYRTWLSGARRSLSFKNRVLTSTRGYGDDLMSSEADAAIALITSRRAGQAPRTYYYLSGLGNTSALKMTCTVVPGKREPMRTGEIATTTTQVAEICRNGPLNVQNLYWVDNAGRVLKSRQWIGRRLGYVTLQHLRI